MIACAVYKILISLFKTIILLGGLGGFVAVYVTYSDDFNSFVSNTCKAKFRYAKQTQKTLPEQLY